MSRPFRIVSIRPAGTPSRATAFAAAVEFATTLCAMLNAKRCKRSCSVRLVGLDFAAAPDSRRNARPGAGEQTEDVRVEIARLEHEDPRFRHQRANSRAHRTARCRAAREANSSIEARSARARATHLASEARRWTVNRDRSSVRASSTIWRSVPPDGSWSEKLQQAPAGAVSHPLSQQGRCHEKECRKRISAWTVRRRPG